MSKLRAFVLTTSMTLACLASPQVFAASADTVLAKSTFATDLDGWTSNTPAEIAWQATGGNPSGVVVFSDQTNAGTYIEAPAKFLSPAIPYAKLSGKGYISWQHKIGKESGVNAVGPYEIRLSGPGGAAKFDGSVPPVTPSAFQTIAAPLLEANWTVTSGTWSALLANVTDMQIDIELVSNNTTNEDVEYIDNVEVVSHPYGFNPGAK
jgi:hypothetical protein